MLIQFIFYLLLFLILIDYKVFNHFIPIIINFSYES